MSQFVSYSSTKPSIISLFYLVFSVWTYNISPFVYILLHHFAIHCLTLLSAIISLIFQISIRYFSLCQFTIIPNIITALFYHILFFYISYIIFLFYQYFTKYYIIMYQILVFYFIKYYFAVLPNIIYLFYLICLYTTKH